MQGEKTYGPVSANEHVWKQTIVLAVAKPNIIILCFLCCIFYWCHVINKSFTMRRWFLFLLVLMSHIIFNLYIGTGLGLHLHSSSIIRPLWCWQQLGLGFAFLYFALGLAVSYSCTFSLLCSYVNHMEIWYTISCHDNCLEPVFGYCLPQRICTIVYLCLI